MIVRHRPHSLRALSVVAFGTLLLAACADPGEASLVPTNPGASATPASSAAHPRGTSTAAYRTRLPASVQESGTIVVATAASSPPLTFATADAQVPQGVEVDLLTEIAKRLQVTVSWRIVPADKITARVSTHAYDLAADGLPLPAGGSAPLAMVTYLRDGTRWTIAAPAKKSKAATLDPRHPCGLRVAVVRTARDQVTAASQLGNACPSDPVRQVLVDTPAAAFDAVTQARADAALTTAAEAGYAVSRNTKGLALAGEVSDQRSLGFGLASDSPEFANTVADVLAEMEADGAYTAVLRTWGVTALAAPSFDVVAP